MAEGEGGTIWGILLENQDIKHMALYEEMVAQGNWLFKRRGYLPLFLLIPAIIIIKINADSTATLLGLPFAYWLYCCLGISLAGLALRIYTIGYAPYGTSGRNTKKQVAEELNTKGIYSIVRHPLYLANFITWLGIALFIPSWSFLVIFLLFYWLYYERIMMAEEHFLMGKFGDAYRNWAVETPAFIPNYAKWQKNRYPFSWKRVLISEYSGLLSILGIFTLLLILQQSFYCGTICFDLIDAQWLTVLVIGSGLALGCRYLKKHTNLLKENN